MSFVVLNPNTKRETGQGVQIKNIHGGKLMAEVIRTCLGPRAMLKMLLDPNGGIVITNDGNSVLREINVNNPSSKSILEIARAQDEEVGDGTTSVVIVGGAVFASVESFIKEGVHATIVCSVLAQLLDDARNALDEMAIPVGNNFMKVVRSALSTKPHVEGLEMMCEMAVDAVRKGGDIKKYVRVEKIPGGSFGDSRVVDGVVLNKDVTHPATMSRRIENPRVVVMDTALEYRKGESQTALELTNDDDFMQVLRNEEEFVAGLCNDIIAVKPDVVIVEKGVSDIAQHLLSRAKISVIRRARKSDLIRIARAVGASIVSDTQQLQEKDVGTECGLFHVRKIGDEYFTFFEKCTNPKACTVMLRGASKDIISEYERSFQDVLHAAKNVIDDPKYVHGGGAVYQQLSLRLVRNARMSVAEKNVDLYVAMARALEVIPLTLAQNAGTNPFKTVEMLRGMHSKGGHDSWGVDGVTGKCRDMADVEICDCVSVIKQILNSAIENVIHILRVDNILSGSKKQSGEEDTSACANPAD